MGKPKPKIMSRHIPKFKIYHHQELMTRINELHVRIKIHLFDIGSPEFKNQHPKPSAQEMDEILSRTITALQEFSTPVKKY